jgi:hypothetical protein
MMMTKPLAFAILLLTAAPAVAQTRSVSDILAFLVTSESVETGAPERDRAAAAATSETISRTLLGNLATLPVSTSSGGFVYRLNPELGTVERATPTFGAFFIERALTAGRRAYSLGLTFQHLRFTSLGGRNLRDGTLVTTANQFVDEPQPYDIDQLTLNIEADVATLYGNAGITERLEIGFAVPMIALRLDGSRVNTYRGTTFRQASATATAIGLADAVVRTKMNVFSDEGAGLAAAVDVRLPTGREQDLLGSGSTAWKFSGIGSLERGRVSSHANVALALGGLADEVSYGAAVAMAATDRLTVSGEMIGRVIDSPGRITSAVVPHPALDKVQTMRLLPDASRLKSVVVSPGLKWNLTQTWVLLASVGVPLTDDGLTAALTPFVGLDYALGR